MRACPVAMTASSSSTARSTRRRAPAGRRRCGPRCRGRGCRLGHAPLEDPQELVAGAEQRDHRVGRGTTRAVDTVHWCCARRAPGFAVRRGGGSHGWPAARPDAPRGVRTVVRRAQGTGAATARHPRCRSATAAGDGLRWQPGGQVIGRPPRTWTWTWSTVWPPSAPVLNTSRKPPSQRPRPGDRGGRGEQLGGQRRGPPRPARRRRGGAPSGSPARAPAPSGRCRGRPACARLVHHGRRDLAGDDPAEQAAIHGGQPTARARTAGQSQRPVRRQERRRPRRCRRSRCAARSARAGTAAAPGGRERGQLVVG